MGLQKILFLCKGNLAPSLFHLKLRRRRGTNIFRFCSILKGSFSHLSTSF
jgi:hypothetical protein